MKRQTLLSAIAIMLIANFLCSSDAQAQIIKGIEDTPPARAVPKPAPTLRTPTLTPVPDADSVKPLEEKPAAEQKPADKEKLEHKIEYSVLLQLRNTTYGSSLLNGSNSGANVATAAANKDTVYNDFRARRLWFGVNGMIDKVWVYRLVINASQLVGNGAASPDNGVATVASGVQEATIGWAPSAAFSLRVGSMKTPFARENLASSASLLTVERALSSQAIGRLFDTGAVVQGKFFEKKFSYALGVFNGNGGFMSGVNGDPNGVSFTSGRIQIDPLGEYKNGEASLSDKLLISIGLAGGYEKNRNGTNLGSPLPASVTSDLVSATADLGFNWGRLNLELAYLTAYSPANGFQFGSVQGYFGTLGFWLIRQTLQAVVRYESYLNAAVAVPVSTTTITNASNAVVDQKSEAAADIREKRYLALGFNVLFLEQAKLRLQIFYHYGLNRYYTTQTDSNPGGGVTRITNTSQDFSHTDDWFVIQLQLGI